MANLIEIDGRRPTIGADVWLAPSATLIGDVHIGDRASVWFGAVLRADFAPITVGEEASIQDVVVIHTAEDLPTRVGARVTVGHGAILEGCEIDRQAVVGMGSVVLQRARVGAEAVVAAGAVVREGQQVEPGGLVAGVPAEKKGSSESTRRWTATASDEYQDLRRIYLKTGVVLEDHEVTTLTRSS